MQACRKDTLKLDARAKAESRKYEVRSLRSAEALDKRSKGDAHADRSVSGTVDHLRGLENVTMGRLIGRGDGTRVLPERADPGGRATARTPRRPRVGLERDRVRAVACI